MWRSVWRSIDRHSLEHFKYVIHELRRIKVVDMHNREQVTDLLQSIAEIATYGDRQDPRIFECFMEFQVLAEFVRVLKISRNSGIEAPLLQYLSIMIQNMDNENAIYYFFSGDYINSIITHPFEFTSGDLASYYISFLRAVSSKLNRDTLCLLVKVHGDVVVSFPLYSEALKFIFHGEKMIQTAVRALTLSTYNVGDDMVCQFITTPPVSEYFVELVHSFREQCVQLDALVHSTKENCHHRRRDEILTETEKLADDLYYFKDILAIGESRLTKALTQNLLRLLVFPLLLPLLQLRPSYGSTVSAVTSLCVISCLLQVIGGKDMVNSVAGVILQPYVTLTIKDVANGHTAHKTDQENSWGNILSNLEIIGWPVAELEEAESMHGQNMLGLLHDNISSHSHVANGHRNDNARIERGGILVQMFSDNQCLLPASLFLLLILAESKDLHYLLASAIGSMSSKITCSPTLDGGFLVRFLPQILTALLKVLTSQTLFPQKLWHTGWLFLKLLDLKSQRLDDDNFCLFNNSYKQSHERLWKELDGCWSDHVLDTLQKEWTSCKSVLEEKSQSKDPWFVLDIAALQQMTDGGTSYFAWQRMVDAVKVFILHVQLKAYISNGHFLEKPLLNLTSSLRADSETHLSNLSNASFGSEVSLVRGVPCKISFSSAGIRDIYLIPVADGASGKLILAEKHPFSRHRGVVIAIAPLAGLNPKMEEDHPTRMHLRIREFDPTFNASKRRVRSSHAQNFPIDGRWTMGFSSKKAGEAARLLILEETRKQRSFIESVLAPLLHSDDLVHFQAAQGE